MRARTCVLALIAGTVLARAHEHGLQAGPERALNVVDHVVADHDRLRCGAAAVAVSRSSDGRSPRTQTQSRRGHAQQGQHAVKEGGLRLPDHGAGRAGRVLEARDEGSRAKREPIVLREVRRLYRGAGAGE